MNSTIHPVFQLLTRVCSDDSVVLFPNNRRQIKFDGPIVIFRSIAADENVSVVFLDEVSVPLNHQPVLKWRQN